MKNIYLILLFSVVFVFLGGSVLAVTDEDISDLIAEIQKEILDYQQKIIDLNGRIANLINQETETWCHTFNLNIDFGESGEEISALQTALEKQGFDCEKETGSSKFGSETEKAVIGFQKKYKEEILTPWGFRSGTGYVGTTTRQKLNELYACEEETIAETLGEAEGVGEIAEEEATEVEEEEAEETAGEIEEVVQEESGELIAESGTCFDSDSGKDYYTEGYTTADGGITKEWDSCHYFHTTERSVDVLYETYCEGGEAVVDEHQCLLGCNVSACVEHRQSDLTFSSVSFSPEEIVTTEVIEFSGTLKNLDNADVPSIVIGYSIKEGETVFSEGTATLEGGLTSKSEMSFSFKTSKAFSKEGDYSAVLTIDPEDKVNESSEANNKIEIEFFVKEKPVCIDSDGKKDVYLKGYTTMDKGITQEWDYCSYDKSVRQHRISEGYCGNDVSKAESFICAYGCLDGVCVKKGIVAYFNFNEEEGSKISDSSGNGLSGTISGAERVEGKEGGALKFSGQSYVKIGDNKLLDLNAEGTFSAWVKYDSSGSGGAVLSKCTSSNSFGGCNYALKLENLAYDSFSFRVGDGKPGFADTAILPSREAEKEVWYYLTAVFDKDSLEIYLNGELKKATPKTLVSAPGINNFDLLLGSMTCNSFSDCNYFKGTIDEVKIYNYALTASEIKTNYGQY
jgi:hypothetical protein